LVRDTSVIEVEVFGLTEKLIEETRRLPGVQAVSATMAEDKQVMRVQVTDPAEMLGKVVAILQDRKVIGVKVKEPTLEDAYLWLVEGDVET
jgi:hypothetical protein